MGQFSGRNQHKCDKSLGSTYLNISKTVKNKGYIKRKKIPELKKT